MSDPQQPKGSPSSKEEPRRLRAAEERWAKAYGEQVAKKLEWDRRYVIVRIGSSEFAFSDYDRYVAALRDAWAAGFVPEHGPNLVRGADLPDAAPALRGVNAGIAPNDTPAEEPMRPARDPRP
jgi:hypothetical protein